MTSSGAPTPRLPPMASGLAALFAALMVAAGCGSDASDRSSAAPEAVSPVAEPNRIGKISDAMREDCANGDGDRLVCKTIQAVDLGIIEEGQQLSNRELKDGLKRVKRLTGLGTDPAAEHPPPDSGAGHR